LPSRPCWARPSSPARSAPWPRRLRQKSPRPLRPPNKPETVEQRITSLKAALKITADQEAKWGTVATAMRDNATAMEKLVQTKRAISPASMTAVDDLKTYQEFTQLRVDGLKDLNSAFQSLYNSMPAAQRKNADQVFNGSAPAKS
jgi:hypothetical protein